MGLAAINPANLQYSIRRFDKIQGETALKIAIIASAIFAGLALIVIPPLGIYAGITVFQLLARSYITPNTFKKEGLPPKKLEKGNILGAGAQKAVYKTNNTAQVCLLGKNRVFNEPDVIREYELKKEIRKKAIRFNEGKSEERQIDVGYLDVEFSEIDYAGHYGIVAPKAEKDLEKKIRRAMGSTETEDLEQRIRYCKDVIKSVEALHSLNICYGDFKPENFLCYGGENEPYPVRLSDFGRAEEVNEGEEKLLLGNPRFAPPEGTLSLSGDVWSTAIVCIRVLEEHCIYQLLETDHNGQVVVQSERGAPLITIDREDKDRGTDSSMSDRGTGSPKYRGIEKYIIDHKAFHGIQSGRSLTSLIRRGKMILPKPEGFAETQSRLVHNYIDTLFENLNQPDSSFKEVLKEMTNPFPTQRPLIHSVLSRLSGE